MAGGQTGRRRDKQVACPHAAAGRPRLQGLRHRRVALRDHRGLDHGQSHDLSSRPGIPGHHSTHARGSSSRLLTGGVATIAGLFPGIAMKLLDFVAIYGMVLMPMGAVIFVDFWLIRKFGLQSNYAAVSRKIVQLGRRTDLVPDARSVHLPGQNTRPFRRSWRIAESICCPPTSMACRSSLSACRAGSWLPCCTLS